MDSESPRLLVVDLPSGSGEEGFMKQGKVCVCVCVCVSLPGDYHMCIQML